MGQSCLPFFYWGFVHHKPGGGKFIRVYVIIITCHYPLAGGCARAAGPMGRGGRACSWAPWGARGCAPAA